MEIRHFFMAMLGERGYLVIKHLLKRFLCLVRGVTDSGVNVYISPHAIVKRGQKIRLGDNVVIERGVRLWVDTEGLSITIGDNSYLSSHCVLNTFDGWIIIGSNCTVNSYAILYGHGGLKIGNDVRIAPQVMIMPMNHIFADPDVPIRKQGIQTQGITVEDDVWLGAGAVVLDGVTIGKGSVIGAGAVVSKDIPPYSIAVGVPARVVKRRGKVDTEHNDI
jgi:acetyltransferase-like isoleucine patch superfamily enzyme